MKIGLRETFCNYETYCTYNLLYSYICGESSSKGGSWYHTVNHFHIVWSIFTSIQIFSLIHCYLCTTPAPIFKQKNSSKTQMQLQKTSARRKLFIFKYIQDMTLCEIEAVAQRCFIRKDVLRNFAKFTGKHLCRSPFFNQVACMRPATLLKETLTQIFSCEFCEI